MNLLPFAKVLRWWPVALALTISVTALWSGYRLAFARASVQTSGRRLLGYGLLTCLSGMCLVLVILSMPVGDAMHGQLLGFFGILISAAIALSSTTLLGNAMAGVMLRIIGNFRPGDFVRVDEYFGRVTELALLHTEIQTELRDLMAIPNLYLVQRPVKVVHVEGTVVTAQVSLGYDASRIDVEDALKEAAEDAGLKDPFVRVLDLGDYSVMYRAAGFLDDTKMLLSVRSSLRAAMMDRLHARGIEIVSPVFQNQRVFGTEEVFMHRDQRATWSRDPVITPESLIFDKADHAETRDQVIETIGSIEERVKKLEVEREQSKAVEMQRQIGREIGRLNELKDQLVESLGEEQVELDPISGEIAR